MEILWNFHGHVHGLTSGNQTWAIPELKKVLELVGGIPTPH